VGLTSQEQLAPLTELTWPDGNTYLVFLLAFQSTSTQLSSIIPTLESGVSALASAIKGKEAYVVLSAAVQVLLSEFNAVMYYSFNDAFAKAFDLSTLLSVSIRLLGDVTGIIIGIMTVDVEAVLENIVDLFDMFLELLLPAKSLLLQTLDAVLTYLEPPGSMINPMVRNATTGAIILSPTQTVNNESGSNGLLLYSETGSLAILYGAGNRQFNITFQGTGSSIPYFSRITDIAGNTIVSAGALNSTQTTGGPVTISSGVATLNELNVTVALSESSIPVNEPVSATINVMNQAGIPTDASYVEVLFAGNVFYATHVSTGTYSITLTTACLPAGSYPVLASAFEPGYFNGAGSQALTIMSTNHESTCIDLNAGWNLVSLPLVPDYAQITTVLKPVLGNVSIVWGYSATTKTWSFFKPPSTGSLRTMQDGVGYWIYMTSASMLNVTGSIIPLTQSPPYYPLTIGWNLVGFKPEPAVVNETVQQYLLSISGSYDPNSVWVYDNLNSSWIRAVSSTQLAPGEAMWIYITSPATLRP
jgi:hypothetical protein